MRQPARLLVPFVVTLFVLLLGGRAIAGFYTEALWFADTGYGDVFWTRVVTEITVRAIATLVAAGIMLTNLWVVARRLGPVHVRRRYGNLEISEQVPRNYVLGGMFVVAVLTGLWLADIQFGGDRSLALLTFNKQVAWGATDPLFQRDLSYYTFTLPVYFQVVQFFVLTLGWSLFLTALGYALVGAVRVRGNRIELDDRPRVHLAGLLAMVVLLVAVRYWLNRYGILFNGGGINGGVGYTDIYARLPAQRVLAFLCLVTSGTLVYSAIRRSWIAPVISGGLLVVAAVVLGYIYPSVIQKLRVEPDQLGREREYIAWNMDFTRRAFGIDSIERRPYPYKRTMPARSAGLELLPLWDSEPLKTVFNQLHSLYGYYHFDEVDSDRYATEGGSPRQVQIGVREFFATGLQENARTWQNLHLNPEYVRGLGAVVVPAAEKLEGRPRYWLQHVPVQRDPAAPAPVALTEPSVYFGEIMEEYAIVNTVLDTTATRTGGIPLSSFARVLAFAWRFSEKNLLFSGQLTDSSRVLMRRKLDDRLRTLAPFILWDTDPHPVLMQGHVYWIIDGYSTSANYPIARPLSVTGRGELRYLRSSVKAVIDAVSGATTLYALNDTEPVLATYRQTFPSLFKSISELPADLAAHLRYPSFLLQAQAAILAQYHIDRPEAFYAAQDVWELPGTRAGEPGNQPFRPHYSMLTVDPGAPPEFVLSAPFIARGRNNLTALLMVRNDPPHYGRMVMLEVPRDEQVPGPAQVEAVIEQDPVVSPQLTLWRQAGSSVTLGQVRIAPIDSTFVYVVPIFLAAQGSPIPELQRVVVSDGDRVVMAEELIDAFNGLRGSSEPVSVPTSESPATDVPAAAPGAAPDGAARALELMRSADAALRNGDWAAYGARQRELRQLLEQMARRRQDQP